jgi:hypothetical protein
LEKDVNVGGEETSGLVHAGRVTLARPKSTHLVSVLADRVRLSRFKLAS